MQRRFSASLFVMCLCSGSILPAQRSGPGVAIEGTGGAAAGRGDEALDRDVREARIAVSFRRVSARHLGLFTELGVEYLARNGDRVNVCQVAPGGSGCFIARPVLLGPTATVGILLQATSVLEFRVGVGGSAYRVSKEQAPNPATIGAFATALDGAVFPTPHIGFVGGVRWLAIPRYRNDRVSLSAWTIGIRLR
jgi:hypothetical protein